MSEWSDLPNAAHIDRVLTSLKKHPEIWDASWDAAWDESYYAAWDAVFDAAWNPPRDAARSEAWHAAIESTRNACRGADWGAGRPAPWLSARGAILALIVYDDCDQYLDMSNKELRLWAILSEHPAAVLLLPAVKAFERIKELETT